MFIFKKKSALPFYIAAAVCIVYAVIFPMHRITDLVIAFAVTAITFILAERFTQKKTVMSKYTLDTGDKEANKAIASAMRNLYEIKQAAFDIKNDVLRTEVTEIVATGTKIIEFVGKDLSSLRKVRTFVDYYLPTTHKLVTAYIEFQNEDDSENVRTGMKKTREIMDDVLLAFKKQQDSLYENKALDITTDITVLERTLKEEGLS